MKKTILFLSFFGMAGYSFGQGCTASNSYTAARYLGYQTGLSGLLEFKTEGITRMNMQSIANSDYTSGRITMGNNIATGFVPQARLHMFQFGTGTANADMFRTDGLNTVNNTWRMYTGASQAAATEKFVVTAVSGTVHATLQTSQVNSAMGFNTGGAVNRMQIVSGGTDNISGRVALSNNGSLTFAPQARLHMYQFGGGTANADMLRTDGQANTDNNWRMYTGASQAAATEKFKLFIPANTNNATLQTSINTGRMYFATNGNTMRMRINGAGTPTINASVVNTEGFIGMGDFNPTLGPLADVNTGPWSQLHINGPNNHPSGWWGNGYRTWMRTGIYESENSDNMYIGMKPELANGTNFSDAVIAFGDDISDPYAAGGPVIGDNFRLISMHPAPAAGDGSGYTSASSLNGREIMRSTTSGLIGMGPAFNKQNETKSELHIHKENILSAWLQISNQFTGANPPFLGPTAILGSDGLRMGIIGHNNTNVNGHALLYNQENRPLLFSTNASTMAVNTNMPTSGATQERVRIQSASTPVPKIGFPVTWVVDNPAAIPANFTRMSVTHNPGQPIWRPLSLLHIGYSAAVNTVGAVTAMDGWRPWMDIGTYIGSPTDNMYVGMKLEGGATHYDAVIAWGRNQDSVSQPSPEKLRFIFNTNRLSTDPINANAARNPDGLEVGRFYAGKDTTGINTGNPNGTWGRFGVGDFTAAGVGQEPTHKLDVVGNGRFRLLPDSLYLADNTVKKVVMVDEAGVLRWSDAVPGGFGYACADTAAVGLTENRYMPMNGFNFHFSGQGKTGQRNAIYVGEDCGAFYPSKFTVRQDTTMNYSTTAGYFINLDSLTEVLDTTVGVIGRAIQAQDILKRETNIGGLMQATGATINVGVAGRTTQTSVAPSTVTNYAGQFISRGIPHQSYGSSSEAIGGMQQNFGVHGRATPMAPYANANSWGGQFIVDAGTGQLIGVEGRAASPTAPSGVRYGGRFEAFYGNTNFGIYAAAAIQPMSWAGYFVGDVYTTGTYLPSDETIKKDIEELKDANEILGQIAPKIYEFDPTVHPQLTLPQGKQMGILAQELQAILPGLVKESQFPARYDSTGAEISPAVNHLAINYTGLIPLLVAGHKEQQQKIDSLETVTEKQDSINNALNDRLNQLEECISALNLCNQQPQMMAPQNSNNASGSYNASSVELSDAPSIILDQNVPNPFAEQTTITFELPQSVQKAQMLFYNAEGKLINSVDIAQRGKGSLNVFANDLSNGIYTYTLVVDGQVKGTKRMVKNK